VSSAGLPLDAARTRFSGSDELPRQRPAGRRRDLGFALIERSGA
jgi:hypothetical protein